MPGQAIGSSLPMKAVGAKTVAGNPAPREDRKRELDHRAVGVVERDRQGFRRLCPGDRLVEGHPPVAPVREHRDVLLQVPRRDRQGGRPALADRVVAENEYVGHSLAGLAPGASDRQQRRCQPEQEPKLLGVLPGSEEVGRHYACDGNEQGASDHLHLHVSLAGEGPYRPEGRVETEAEYEYEQGESDEPELDPYLEVRVVRDLGRPNEVTALGERARLKQVMHRGDRKIARTDALYWILLDHPPPNLPKVCPAGATADGRDMRPHGRRGDVLVVAGPGHDEDEGDDEKSASPSGAHDEEGGQGDRQAHEAAPRAGEEDRGGAQGGGPRRSQACQRQAFQNHGEAEAQGEGGDEDRSQLVGIADRAAEAH